MRSGFGQLVQKEVRQGAPAGLAIAAVVVAWHLFLHTRIGRWPTEVVVALGALPFGFVPLWLLWRSFATMRQEWAGNHMHLLLALPVPGWAVAAAKIVVVMVEAAFFAAIIGGGIGILALRTGLAAQIPWDEIQPSRGALAVMAVMLVFSPLTWIVVTQFAYVAGRLASKMSWLVSAVAFMLSGWFIVRTGTVLAPLFRWVPQLPLSAATIVNGIVVKAGLVLDWTPAVGTLLALGLLFWATAALLERDVEL